MDFWLFWQWKHALFAVEAVLFIVLLNFSCRFAGLEKALKRLARHRLAPLAVGGFALLLRAAMLPSEPVPSPSVHDEFSYLLAADTFAHGRLTNPTHPMWQHLETFHVNQVPTYQSKYPPLQGMVLALGQVLTGSAFTGVWLSVGVMCAVLCWALRGWFPPGWAMLAGGIAAIRIAMFSYWGDSYWGGALAAIGGALVFGALPRLIRQSRPRDALLAALGVAMLANTRPYEGLVFSAGVAAVALWQMRKLRLRSILPTAAAVLVCAGAFMGYYNWRGTGSPATMPYTVNFKSYNEVALFFFQKRGPEIAYRHPTMQTFYTQELKEFEASHKWDGFWSMTAAKLDAGWQFYLGPVLTIPLLASFWTWRSWRTAVPLFLLGLMSLAAFAAVWFNPHYFAPATVAIYALIVQGLRRLKRGWPQLVRAVPLVCVIMAAVRLGLGAAGVSPEAVPPMTWARSYPGPLDRESVAAPLLAEGGKHLVIVRYTPAHDPGHEFVYNAADIDASPIVWARDMGAEKNAELLRYFSTRKVWLLDADPEPALGPYKP